MKIAYGPKLLFEVIKDRHPWRFRIRGTSNSDEVNGLNLITEGFVGDSSFNIIWGKISVDDTAEIVTVDSQEFPFEDVRLVAVEDNR